MKWGSVCFFFFNDTATTEIYTLSLHDALPISEAVVPPGVARTVSDLMVGVVREGTGTAAQIPGVRVAGKTGTDRKSTRLNSSHANISYAVFCLKKKKTHL